MSTPLEFPLPSLRKFMMPDQTVQIKTFQANNIEQLDNQINIWVQKTKNIIAVPGVISIVTDGVIMSLTFVGAVEGAQNG